jgi:hypothetical protein
MRVATVVDAPALPPKETYFAITSKGIIDINPKDLSSKEPIEFSENRKVEEKDEKMEEETVLD